MRITVSKMTQMFNQLSKQLLIILLSVDYLSNQLINVALNQSIGPTEILTYRIKSKGSSK